MIPFITIETVFREHVDELFFGIDMFDLNFWSKLLLSDSQSDVTPWVREMCHIVGRLSLIIILITVHCPQKDKAKRQSEKVFRLIWRN